MRGFKGADGVFWRRISDHACERVGVVNDIIESRSAVDSNLLGMKKGAVGRGLSVTCDNKIKDRRHNAWCKTCVK